jgi:DNA-binding response OmpR family regulator
VETDVTTDRKKHLLILVVEDVEEIRHGIEQLLTASGYQVSTARDEEEAVKEARCCPPDLILLSFTADIVDIVSIAVRMRGRSRLSEQVPVVIFCVRSLQEGDVVEAGRNVYLTRPDNFDQLRASLRLLLSGG